MIYKCTSSLRLFSESMSVSELSTVMNSAPDTSYEKGDSTKSKSGVKRKQSM